jgi:3-oxoadipate enol-lactonase/4-carboxymuconolactone decarboxylase
MRSGRPGARLYISTTGAIRRGLVLLNSIGTDMDLWDAVLPHLRDRFALLRIDTRGRASLADPGDYSLAQLADDVLAAADAVGFARLPWRVFRSAG